MARTDEPAAAIAKATAKTSIPLPAASMEVWDASGTQMVFYTAEGVLTCEATLWATVAGGDPVAQPDIREKKVVRFALADALPPDLVDAARLIQAYLHNRAVELVRGG